MEISLIHLSPPCQKGEKSEFDPKADPENFVVFFQPKNVYYVYSSPSGPKDMTGRMAEIVNVIVVLEICCVSSGYHMSWVGLSKAQIPDRVGGRYSLFCYNMIAVRRRYLLLSKPLKSFKKQV